MRAPHVKNQYLLGFRVIEKPVFDRGNKLLAASSLSFDKMKILEDFSRSKNLCITGLP